MVVAYFNSRPHLYVAIFTSEKGISLGILLLLFSMFIERDGGKIILVSLHYLFCEGANWSYTMKTTPNDVCFLLFVYEFCLSWLFRNIIDGNL